MLAIKSLNNNSTVYRRTANLMGNKFEISVVESDALLANKQIGIAFNEISRVEKLLSAFGEDSCINQINRNAGIAPVKTNPEVFGLIDRALQISALTHGAFDITYLAAKNGLDSSYKTELASYHHVVLNHAQQTVFLKEPNMRIGFGANSKGYAADRARYILQLNGVTSGVINAGGDLLTWGAQPDGNQWTVAAADPEQHNHPFADMDISNMAFATSVNAEKYASIGSKTRVNPVGQNGFAVSEIKSVSVISPTAEFADAMATPIIRMGLNAGLYLVNQLNQVAAIVIDDLDRVYASKGIKN